MKPTKDPLDGVSRLDFVNLVSITQRQNSKYIEKFKEKDEWNNFDHEQRRQFEEAFKL